MIKKLKSYIFKNISKDSYLLILVCGLMFLKRFSLLEYGYNYEEGKELECIINILNGKLVFKDFWWQYGAAT